MNSSMWAELGGLGALSSQSSVSWRVGVCISVAFGGKTVFCGEAGCPWLVRVITSSLSQRKSLISLTFTTLIILVVSHKDLSQIQEKWSRGASTKKIFEKFQTNDQPKRLVQCNRQSLGELRCVRFTYGRYVTGEIRAEQRVKMTVLAM